ncbi:DUF115 domain-containing protein [Sporosarcina sp. PTS2304]|uniref:motility associated factor glycosyltransferase family protein n=1 Tax=Sporosarcina sp. PTS2304 TaxID=2283194 RepID=UPI000E0D8CD7|nr:6-hydroxymethylpterin diphosphokinase MptE-like protein [Sporosarcina sp. PTS2304]AXH98428.1 DUF115 domain-containing protein [Sporosarcina sp. PTS2304]
MVSMKVEVLESKSGLPTLQVEQEGKKIFIHSKYDPIKEARQIIERNKEQIEQHQHIFFYGVGLGYHLQAFIEQYPEKLVSAYEPIAELATVCNSLTDRTAFDAERLRHLFIEQEPTDRETHLRTLSNHLTQKVALIILPSYERFLKEDILAFLAEYKEIIEEKQITRGANTVFSKRWTVNALLNVPSTFETPNFLLEHARTFCDKPVLLVAAGPSLSEEMDNLRLIKEQGTAYIFAVGSANKALIANDIHPDAVFTYDPQAHNYAVFQPIMDEKITTIPMVYGTSVGFETIQLYPGPKLHFVTSQDTITQQFHETELPVISDAYSIAIVTMELLHQLQVKTIILVGQNFAFKNDLFYAKEIKRYDKDTRELSDASVQKKDTEGAFYVQDVYGNDILTNDGFNNMRKAMEKQIAKHPAIPVINTTRGGAAINGTTFQSLAEVMKQRLIEKVTEDDWYTKGSSLPATKKTEDQIRELRKSIADYRKQDVALFAHFKEVEQVIDSLNMNQLQKRFEKTDELVRKLTSNKLYDLAIRPITRNTLETLMAEVELLRKMEISKEKLVIILNLFAEYFNRCRIVYREIAPITQTTIRSIILHTSDKKEYIATSGVFQYEGQWEKQFPPVDIMPDGLTEEEKQVWYEKKALLDRIEQPVSSVRTKEKNASFTFKMTGTSLRIYGTNHSETNLKLRVSVDHRILNVTVRERVDEELFGTGSRQLVVKIEKLPDVMHEIKIEVLSDHPDFLVEAIEIDKTARAYHIHEVETVDELAIGKRIRCNYKATYNTVGEFSSLGKESKNFLPVEASAEPDGDFYFIMVDEVDGEKKLIADRNVQNYISWVTIESSLEKIEIEEIVLAFRTLIDSENPSDNLSEWNKYIVNATTSSLLNWNYYSSSSWTMTKKINDKNFNVSRGGGILNNYLVNQYNQIDTVIKQRGFRPVIIKN